jgi:CARDB
MRFLRLSILVGALVAGAAGAASASATVVAPPRAELVRFSCQSALDPVSRSIGVRAVMRPLTGTEHMSVRFDLVQRVGAAAPSGVRAGDLGVWVSPANPTLGQVPGDVWRLDKRVIDLAAPATYQFRVAFRWTGAAGHVLGTVVRYSRRCHQPELRPDLAVTSLTVAPVAGDPQHDLYTAVIANRGLTGAGPFQVLFVPGGTPAPMTDFVPSLAAGRSRTLSFTGPVCNSSDPPSVTADSAHQVDDFNRANNTATAVCPASG